MFDKGNLIVIKYKKYFIIYYLFLFSGLPFFSVFFFKLYLFYKISNTNLFFLVFFIFFSFFSLFIYHDMFTKFFSKKKEVLVKKKKLQLTGSLFIVVLFNLLFNLSFFFLFFLVSKPSYFRSNKFRKHIKKAFVLRSHPQKLGYVDRVRITTPRKPNSAKRKTLRVFYYHFIKKSITYIPGGPHNLKRNSKVLVRGRGPRDTPGVYTSCIRGKCDLIALVHKSKRRSIYGVKLDMINKNFSYK